MPPDKLLLVALAAMGGGIMNAIAGGGTLLTFPALVGLGVPPIVANATSTVALWPGSLASFWGYRQAIRDIRPWWLHWATPSLLGGIAGAILLLLTPERDFAAIVPWLIWGATALFVLQQPMMRWIGGHAHEDRDAARHAPPFRFLVWQFIVAVYGGYFGAGAGILMLAAFEMMGLRNIHTMNGLKNWCGMNLNAIAVAVFIVSGIILWPVALTMAVGAMAGGAFGSRMAQVVGPRWVRRAVVAIGIGSGVAMFVSEARAQGSAPRLEALWYARGEASVQSFVAHADQISIISPQTFTLDSTGAIRGGLDPRIVATARERGVKLVPLVMNPGFDQRSIHRVLTNSAVRATAIANLGRMCSVHRLDGIQFDIENFHVSDKGAFTSFVRDAAAEIRRAGCGVSAAVVPRAGEDRGPTSYHQWIWDNWRGGFDYKALAESLDFISYMTYAQHTGGSPPGPVAGYPWVEECLKYVLSLGVPPEKISLGLAAYSDWWYPAYDATNGSRVRGSDIPYERAMELLARAGVAPVWDDVQKAQFAQWENRGVFELAWLEDARAFAAKLQLVRRYSLRGYSVWKLGDEDPRIWEVVR